MNDQPKKFGRRYPWAKWFGKVRFTLRRGTHYDCMTHAMAQMVRNVATSPKYRLKTTISIHEDDRIVVEVVGKLPAPSDKQT